MAAENRARHLLIEGSEIGRETVAFERLRHRVERRLGDGDRLAGERRQGLGHVVRGVRARTGQVHMARALGPLVEKRRGERSDVPRRHHVVSKRRGHERREHAVSETTERATRVLHEVRGADERGERPGDRPERLLCAVRRHDGAGAGGVLRADRRQIDDVRDGARLHRCDDRCERLGLIGAHVGDPEHRRDEQVRARRPGQRRREGLLVAQIGDRDLGPFLRPRLALGPVAHDDSHLRAARDQRVRDDFARVPRNPCDDVGHDGLPFDRPPTGGHRPNIGRSQDEASA